MKKELRSGYSTGTCAMVAASSATTLLLENKKETTYQFEYEGQSFNIEIFDHTYDKDTQETSCYVIKDSGDDIDITNHAKIYVKAKKIPSGIEVVGGKGIGTVTQKGLKVPIGQSAINPMPMKMIKEAVAKVCQRNNYQEGIHITIEIPNGQELAKATFNANLGIIGGLSILGSTGVVRPMSQKALIATIDLQIKYLKTNFPNSIILFSPGNYGNDFIRNELHLKQDIVSISNFLGESIDIANDYNVERVLLVAHIGKLIKVAASIMNTHSSYADGRKEVFITYAALAKAPYSILEQLDKALTTTEMVEIIEKFENKQLFYEKIIQQISKHLNKRSKQKIDIQFIAFNETKGIIFKSNKALQYIKELEKEPCQVNYTE